jgi:hypothetical protein
VLQGALPTAADAPTTTNAVSVAPPALSTQPTASMPAVTSAQVSHFRSSAAVRFFKTNLKNLCANACPNSNS